MKNNKEKKSGLLSVVFIVLIVFLLCFLQSTFAVYYSLQPEHNQEQQSLSADHSFQPTTSIRREKKKKKTEKRSIPSQSLPSDADADDHFIVEERWSTINATRLIRDGINNNTIHLFTNPKHIDVIRIIGERHSGTTFFEKYLKDCLLPTQQQQQQQQIQVVSYLVRKKHWFQPTPTEIIESVQRIRENNNLSKEQQDELLKPTELGDDLHMLPEIDRRPYKSWMQIADDEAKKAPPSSSKATTFNTSLVLLLVRNPYDWLEAMRLKPHHWPNHVDLIPLDKANSTTLKRVDYKSQRQQKQGSVEEEGKQEPLKQQQSFPRRRRLMDMSLLKYRQQQQRIISDTATRNNMKGKDPRNHPQQGRKMKTTRTTTIQDTPQGTAYGDRIPSGFSLHKSYFTKSTLDWKEFINRPMRLIDEKNEFDNSSNNSTSISFNTSHQLLLHQQLCQKGFEFGYVSPCKRNKTYIPNVLSHIPKSFLRKLPFDINDVVYEQRQRQQSSSSSSRTSSRSSSSYSHPMELRGDKILNFLNIPTNWDLGGFALIRYETILGPTKLQEYVDNMFTRLKIQSQYQSCPSSSSSSNNKPYLQERRYIPNEFKQWITDNTDWNIESLVGYYPENDKK